MNQSYINYLKASKKSPQTIELYTNYINRFLNWIDKDETEVTFTDIVDYQANLETSPATICTHLASLKSYYGFLKKAGIVAVNPAEEVEKPKVNSKPKHYMDKDMITAMVANARTSRDKAIILFYATTGVRVSELINITLEDYYNSCETHEITILGKGNKKRVVYVNAQVREAIEAYLKDRAKYDCPYLFMGFQGRQMRKESLSRTLKCVARNAGIPFWEDISNHAMRSAFATIASENGVPVDTIKEAMGHANLKTTSIYIKNTQKNINNAMANMVF